MHHSITVVDPSFELAFKYFSTIEKAIKLSAKPEQVVPGIAKALLNVRSHLGKNCWRWTTPKTDEDGRRIEVWGSFLFEEKTYWRTISYRSWFSDAATGHGRVEDSIFKDREKDLCPKELVVIINGVKHSYNIAEYFLLEKEILCPKPKKKLKNSSINESKKINN